jgi:hypothetical protein
VELRALHSIWDLTCKEVMARLPRRPASNAVAHDAPQQVTGAPHQGAALPPQLVMWQQIILPVLLYWPGDHHQWNHGIPGAAAPPNTVHGQAEVPQDNDWDELD